MADLITPENVRTIGQFYEYVNALSYEPIVQNGRTLDEYLRALWTLARREQDTAPTWALFARLLTDACSAAPDPFDEAWLSYTAPFPRGTRDTGFVGFQDMILYQIADLHRMTAVGTINDPMRYFGIDSPTGHRWYNFEVAAFLERGSTDHYTGEEELACTWDILTGLLWMGQVYE